MNRSPLTRRPTCGAPSAFFPNSVCLEGLSPAPWGGVGRVWPRPTPPDRQGSPEDPGAPAGTLAGVAAVLLFVALLPWFGSHEPRALARGLLTVASVAPLLAWCRAAACDPYRREPDALDALVVLSLPVAAYLWFNTVVRVLEARILFGV